LDANDSGVRGKASALYRLRRLVSCVKGKMRTRGSVLGCMGTGQKAVSPQASDASTVDNQIKPISGWNTPTIHRADPTGGPVGGGLAALRCSEDGVRRTVITIESFVDSKGSIPAWFINYMQRYRYELLTVVTD